MTNIRYDADASAWQTVQGDSGLSYPLHYDFQLLGHDHDNATIDFVLRFFADGGHCQRHRHIADSTTVIVIEGQQHLDDLHPDGSLTHRTRSAGEYSRSSGADELPHMERGGADGAIIFYSCHARDGRLFEFLDDDLKVIREVTIDDMLRSWAAFKSEQAA